MTLAPEYGAFEAHKINVGRGWWPLLADAHRQLSEVWPEYRISQVKEKFGALRIYLSYPYGTPGQLNEVAQRCEPILADLEQQSALTCEFCGQPGVRRGTRWIKTLCDACSGGAPVSSM